MVQIKLEKKIFSQSFSLFALCGIVVLSACSGAGVKKDYGIHWNEATVSEKGLNDSGCKFEEKVAADGTKREELVCDDNATPEQVGNREKAFNAYVASAEIALKTPDLNPLTRIRILFRNLKVQNKLTMMKSARAMVPAANAVRNADFMNLDVAKILLTTYTSLLAGDRFDCTFDASNEFVCSKSAADIKAAGNAENFKRYLTSLSTSQGKILFLDTKLSKEEKAKMEAQKASLDAFIEDLNCRDCAQ